MRSGTDKGEVPRWNPLGVFSSSEPHVKKRLESFLASSENNVEEFFFFSPSV